MTREEQIAVAFDDYSDARKLSTFDDFEYTDIQVAFEEGAEWADTHPKSTWISVDDDLPYRHKELLLSTGYHTVSVFTYKKGGACGIDSMINRSGKWEWEAWKENYLYWMPIPNLPKE